MSEGRERILKMLETGIISAEDARRLLEALGEPPELTVTPDNPAERAEAFRQEAEAFRQEAEEFQQQAESAAGQAAVPSLTLYPDGMEGFDGEIPVPPAPPVPPVPPEPAEPPEIAVPPVPEIPEDRAAATETAGGNYSNPGTDIRQVSVEWISGSVQVCCGDGEEIQVTETARRPLSEGEKMVVTRENGRLHIAWNKSHFRLPGFRPLEKHLVISLPKTMILDALEIGTVSAGVSLRGLSGQNLNAHTVSGEISAYGLQAQSIQLSATSGCIDGQRLQADRLKLSTVSGRITGDFGADTARLSSTSGRVEAHGDVGSELTLSSVSGSVQFDGTAGRDFKVNTTSGKQYLALKDMPRTIKCGSVSGSVELLLPDSEGGFSAEYSTVSGKFACDFPVTGKQEKRSGSARYGAGSTRLTLSTTSGAMRIGRL